MLLCVNIYSNYERSFEHYRTMNYKSSLIIQKNANFIYSKQKLKIPEMIQLFYLNQFDELGINKFNYQQIQYDNLDKNKVFLPKYKLLDH